MLVAGWSHLPWKPGLTCNDGAGCKENVVDWDHCGRPVEFCGLVQEPVEDGNHCSSSLAALSNTLTITSRNVCSVAPTTKGKEVQRKGTSNQRP